MNRWRISSARCGPPGVRARGCRRLPARIRYDRPGVPDHAGQQVLQPEVQKWRKIRVTGNVPGGPAAEGLAELGRRCPAAGIRPVVSVPGPGGVAELLAVRRLAGPLAARLPVRQASPGFGSDLRQPRSA